MTQRENSLRARERPLILKLLSALLFFHAAGCGSDRLASGTEGTITVAGEPVVDVRVNVFALRDGKPIEMGFAVSGANGKLHFVLPKAAGPLVLAPGTYQFTVEPVGAPLKLPKEYSDPEKTPLRIELPTSEGILLNLPEPK